jgi:hypothetical protein
MHTPAYPLWTEFAPRFNTLKPGVITACGR